MLEELIGSKLLSFNNDGFSVKTPNGEIRNFVYGENEGGCCGYNDLSTELLISETELGNNPIITNIEKKDTSEESDGESVIITFFGESKPIATIDSLSSSGSGWCYGACVWVECKETNDSETITSW